MALETFLSGYRGREAQMGAEQAQQLRQMSTLQSILANAEAAKQKRVAAQREAQYRQAVLSLKPDATPEDFLKAAMPYMDADKLGPMISASADRKLATENRKQIALQRLQQQISTEARHAYEFAATLPLKERRAALDEINSRAQNTYRAGSLAVQAGNLDYNTGADTSGIMALVDQLRQTQIAPRSPGAPDISPVASQPGDIPAGAVVQAPGGVPHRMEIAVPPDERAAYESVLAGLSRQKAAPARAAPTAPPMPPASPAPAAAVVEARMPTFSGSPAEQARARNTWLLAKAKHDIKADVNLAGGRESTFINRVVMSGNQAAADLETVVQLPMTASRGIFGGRGQDTGIFNAGKETLANKMTTQEVQTYNVAATGFQRALAAIEGAGLAPTNALMHQMDAVIFKEGDTNFTKLTKLAQTRQIVAKGLETISANPRVPDETKRHIDEILAKVNKAVPFTTTDLLTLQKQQAINPNTTLEDIKGMRGTTDIEERLKKYR